MRAITFLFVEWRDELWSTFHKQKRYSAHIDPPEVLVHCKLTQVHMPRGSAIEIDTVLDSFATATARGISNA